MPVCSRCGRTYATAELRRRKPPYTGEYVCKDKCVSEKRPGQIVVNETRVRIPGGELGTAIAIHKPRSYWERKHPARIVIELDTGERRVFTYSQLRAAS